MVVLGFFVGSMLLSAGVAGPASARAEADGTWPQAQGDAARSGVGEAPSPPYRQLWTTPVAPGGPQAGFGLSTPVTDGQTVVAVGPESVLGFDAQTGAQRWSHARDFGPSAAPALATIDGRTLVVYTEGFGDNPPTSATLSPTASPSVTTPETGVFDSHLEAFDPRAGKVIFDAVRLKAVSRSGVAIDGTMAYVGDDDGNVYAIDLADGSIVWTVQVGGIVATPIAVSGDQLVVTVQGDRETRPAAVALNTSDGSQRWRSEGEGAASLVTAPTIGATAVYMGLNDGTVRALDPESGTLLWTARLTSPLFTGGFAVTDDALYVVDVFGEVYRLDAATGSRTWDFALNQSVLRSPPVVVGGTHVLVATGDGSLNAIDVNSGHLVWRSTSNGSVLRGLALTPERIVGVRGGDQAGVVAFEADPSGTLIDVVSPTVLDSGGLALNFLIAAVPFTVILIVVGGWLSRRMGPAFIVVDEQGRPIEPDEVQDPWAVDEDEDA